MNQAEIFAEIKRRRYEAEEEGWTSIEYARKLGVSEATGRRQVREGVRDGTIKPVGHKPVPNPNGRVSWLPIYLFVTDASETSQTDHRTQVGKTPVARIVPSRRNGRN